ncbi:caspase-3 [Ixodes scapularis]
MPSLPAIGQRLDEGVALKSWHSVEEEFYPVTVKNGVCVIAYYTKYPDGPKRGESMPDILHHVTKLNDVWSKRGFLVETYTDLSEQELYDKMANVASMEILKESDASFVCILLPCGRGGQLFASDGPLQLHRLAEPFAGRACDTLVGKPKLFFIDAFGGEPIGHTVDGIKEGEGECSRIPELADFFFAFSTPPGYYDRGLEKRGYFVEELCDILACDITEVELSTLMEMVTKRVAIKIKYSLEYHVPSYMSTLTKRLKFRSIDDKTADNEGASGLAGINIPES